MSIRGIARMTPAQFRLARSAPHPADGFTSRWTTAAGLRLHSRQRVAPGAAGPPWVLVHGLAVSHRYLMPTAAALPGPVYVPDLPGFGLSQHPARAFDTGQHAAAVAAWMDAEGITTASVLGNSFGCQVAVELAVRRPDLVTTLVLVGPTVDPAAPTATGQAMRWLRDLAFEDLKQAPIIVADVRDAGPRRVLATLRHSVRHHIEQQLPLVQAPVLVLRGEHDRIASTGWIDQVAALARTGSSGIVAGAAHNAITTAGTEVASRAAAFAGTPV